MISFAVSSNFLFVALIFDLLVLDAPGAGSLKGLSRVLSQRSPVSQPADDPFSKAFTLSSNERICRTNQTLLMTTDMS